MIGGGRDNVVENNVIVDSAMALWLDARGLGWAAKYQARGGGHEMYKKLVAVNYDRPPWSERYPSLFRILSENPHAPKGNVIRKNVAWRCEKWGRLEGEYAILENNLKADGDPGFVDAEGRDFRLREDSEVLKKIPGFTALPIDEMGLYRDQWRQEVE
ncbi:hypothetical protein HQ520_15210 [bacterium]|nr:hypothetical protein [bacterium]